MNARVLRWSRIAALAGTSGLAIALLSGAAWERVSRNRALRAHPAPGRLVEVGGGLRIQMDCRGAGSPTVVLESGLDTYGSLAWASVHDSLAAITRVCAYSRAGVMWSDARSGDFHADSAARVLHSALAAAGEAGPWVMVGHSIGGAYVLAFASRYPQEVKGFVMVDASHPDQFPAFQRAVGKSIAPSATLPRVAAALAWTGLVRMLPVPPEPAHWPTAIRSAAPVFLPTSVGGIASEVAAVPATLSRAAQLRSLGDRPLVVLAVADAKGAAELAQLGISESQGARLDSARLRLASDMARWSSRGRLELVERSSHYLQVDRPEVVVSAVREVVAYVIANDPTTGRR